MVLHNEGAGKQEVAMLVKNWMSKKVITVDVNESMQNATMLMRINRVRMLPVVKKNKLVGIISDRDLKKASASDATSLEIHELLFLLTKIKIKDIMTKEPITVTQDWTIEETAELLLNNKISGVPVIDDKGTVLGVITQTDVFRVLLSLTGYGNGDLQIACQVADRPGTIKEIEDLIRRFGGRIVSILSSYDRVPEGSRMVYLRLRDVEQSRVWALKNELRDKTDLHYLIDYRENRREFYK